VAKPTDVQDQQVRDLLLAAEQALDARDYLGSVRRSMEAYTQLIATRPDVIVHPSDLSGAAPSFDRVLARTGPRPWPDVCGVDLIWERPNQPYLREAKERFTFSDAVTVLEYTLDTAIRAQRTQAATSSK
jgi:hypothetical protein